MNNEVSPVTNLVSNHAIHLAWRRIALLLATVLLVAMTIVVLRLRRTRPYLFVGWFWYLGTLVPVIGLVQVGRQAMADRVVELLTDPARATTMGRAGREQVIAHWSVDRLVCGYEKLRA